MVAFAPGKSIKHLEGPTEQLGHSPQRPGDPAASPLNLSMRERSTDPARHERRGATTEQELGRLGFGRGSVQAVQIGDRVHMLFEGVFPDRERVRVDLSGAGERVEPINLPTGGMIEIRARPGTLVVTEFEPPLSARMMESLGITDPRLLGAARTARELLGEEPARHVLLTAALMTNNVFAAPPRTSVKVAKGQMGKAGIETAEFFTLAPHSQN